MSLLKKAGSFFVLVLVFTGSLQARGLPDFTELVEDTSAAVVNISTTQKVKSGGMQLPEGIEIPDLPEGSPFNDLFKHFFGEQGRGGAMPPQREAKSLGSGFIISKDGYVLTNNHVVKDADEITVRLADRRELKARVIGTDERSDVALLKIEADDLPVVKIGKSEDLKVGEWVLAIGSPFGFDRTATAGIVSAKGRALPRENYVPFIQTDVAINPGNSGGPLFNLDGEVVGVNSQIYSRTGGFMGLSFSIPIEVAMDVANQLKANGKVSRGWLGVLIQDVTLDLAESFGMSKPQGALIAKVMPNSPAEKAKFQVGDVVLAFNGKEIDRSSSLPPVVGSTPVGKRVPVKVMRNKRSQTLWIELGELPDKDKKIAKAAESKVTSDNRLGVQVADLTADQRKELDLEGGVLVDSIGEGPAANAGIRQGDIILRINSELVKDVDQFEKMIKKLPVGKSVPVLVQRRGGPIFLALKVPKDS
ncbi:HtrA protease/chaperone protein [hydrothermal vent metagenome]|uniref:Probable periplasmic serine endoprotease DegP-like n=1 Tax=hydrothermal vent metagenome TaxID=652676 RepID=A0A3B0ZDA7_9ZZZZ